MILARANNTSSERLLKLRQADYMKLLLNRLWKPFLVAKYTISEATLSKSQHLLRTQVHLLLTMQAIWILVIIGAVMAMERANDENADDANEQGSSRHRQSYSLNQKIDFIETFQLEHAIGLPHAETASSFAEHHRLAPRTFRQWISDQDELYALRDRSSQAQRRRRRQRQHGTDQQGNQGNVF